MTPSEPLQATLPLRAILAILAMSFWPHAQASPVAEPEPAQAAAERTPRVFLTGATLAQLRAQRRSAEFGAYRALGDAVVRQPDQYSDVVTWHVAALTPLTDDVRYCAHSVPVADAMVTGDQSHRRFGREGFLRAPDDLQDLLLTLDWCYPQVSAEQRSKWIDYANRGIDLMWRSNDRHWPFDDPHNNYWYAFIEATMLAALVTEGDNPRAAEFAELFKHKVETVMLPQWQSPNWSGGGGKEGTHYDKWQRRLWRTLAWWRDAGGADYLQQVGPRTEEQINYWLHQVTPGRDYLFQWGDEAQDARGSLNGPGRELFLILIGLAPSSPEAGHAKDFLARSAWAAFPRRADRPLAFLFNTSAVPPRPLLGKPDVYLFTPPNGAGKAFIRTGWGTDASAISYTFRSRQGAASSHDHIDKPGFQWWANGSWVVLDPNFYSRSGIVGAINAGGSQVANIVRLEGVDHDAETRQTVKVLAERDESGADPPHYYHSFDAQSLWRQASVYRRDYVFLPPDVLVVFDRIVAQQAKSWQINVAARPELDGGTIRIGAGKHALRVFNLLPSGLQSSVLDYAVEGCCGAEFSGGFRLAFADAAVDSVSVKVLDIGNRVRTAECERDGQGARCTIELAARAVSIEWPADGGPALLR